MFETESHFFSLALNCVFSSIDMPEIIQTFNNN